LNINQDNIGRIQDGKEVNFHDVAYAIIGYDWLVNHMIYDE
jgi:hypothetical protein